MGDGGSQRAVPEGRGADVRISRATNTLQVQIRKKYCANRADQSGAGGQSGNANRNRDTLIRARSAGGDTKRGDNGDRKADLRGAVPLRFQQ